MKTPIATKIIGVFAIVLFAIFIYNWDYGMIMMSIALLCVICITYLIHAIKKIEKIEEDIECLLLITHRASKEKKKKE